MVDTFITLDTSNLTKAAKDLRKVAPELAKELNKELKAAAQIIVTEAKAEAQWSSRIPALIKVERRGLSVKIVAGAGQRPHESEAHAFEHGGLPGKFRHPVGGNRENWVSQDARPFIAPAFLARIDPAMNRIVAAIDRALGAL